MKPTIVQRSHSQMLQVLRAEDHVTVPWDWTRWHLIKEWRIIKLFPGRNLETAIRFAKQVGGFDPRTLRETLGSWDAKNFAPNPPPDEEAIAIYRQNLREYANAVRPDKRKRDQGKKTRRARRALLEDEDDGVTTVRTSRL